MTCKGRGGEGGIRTHGKFHPTSDFESGALNHSATSPWLGGVTLSGRRRFVKPALHSIGKKAVVRGSPGGCGGVAAGRPARGMRVR